MITNDNLNNITYITITISNIVDESNPLNPLFPVIVVISSFTPSYSPLCIQFSILYCILYSLIPFAPVLKFNNKVKLNVNKTINF